MKIGYPCINWRIGCKGDRTFRLRSYSEERLTSTVQNNLDCLVRMLQFNAENNILFFRITSDLVPFASHPVCQFDWQQLFAEKFQGIGELIRHHNMRISMHPDQFVLINPVDNEIFQRSVNELLYHTEILDLMGLDASAKIQIHLGGVYGDKAKSMSRFVERYAEIGQSIRRRLVLENDETSYSLSDCLSVSSETGIPVLFDVFHHETNNRQETMLEAFRAFTKTWKPEDGLPMVDYSSQQEGKTRGSHAASIDPKHFERFLAATRPFDFDVMLEIKDKEASALQAVKAASTDRRVHRVHASDSQSV
jgi:UV DNA damage endonuclease